MITTVKAWDKECKDSKQPLQVSKGLQRRDLMFYQTSWYSNILISNSYLEEVGQQFQ